jgi:hypothetical protein
VPDVDHLAEWISVYPEIGHRSKTSAAWDAFLRSHPVPATRKEGGDVWMDLLARLQE